MLSARQFFPIGIIMLILVSVLVVAFNKPEDSTEIHCAVGTISAMVFVGAVLTGPLLKGRLGRIDGLNPYPLHRYAMLVLAIYLTGVFVLGIYVSGWSDPVGNVHGILGILIVVLAWAMNALSPCAVKKMVRRIVISNVHRAMAVLLVSTIVAQILYGYLAVGR